MNGEVFLVIPGTPNASKKGLKVRTILPGQAASNYPGSNFAGSGNAFEQRAAKFAANGEHELTKTTDGDPLLERFFEAATCPVPSLSENFQL